MEILVVSTGKTPLGVLLYKWVTLGQNQYILKYASGNNKTVILTLLQFM